MTSTVYVIVEYTGSDITILNPIFTSKVKAEALVKTYEERDRKITSYYYPVYEIEDYDLVGDDD